jgi:hypothetical protein
MGIQPVEHGVSLELLGYLLEALLGGAKVAVDSGNSLKPAAGSLVQLRRKFTGMDFPKVWPNQFHRIPMESSGFHEGAGIEFIGKQLSQLDVD